MFIFYKETNLSIKPPTQTVSLVENIKRRNSREYHPWGLFDINNKSTLHDLDNS